MTRLLLDMQAADSVEVHPTKLQITPICTHLVRKSGGKHDERCHVRLFSDVGIKTTHAQKNLPTLACIYNSTLDCSLFRKILLTSITAQAPSQSPSTVQPTQHPRLYT